MAIYYIVLFLIFFSYLLCTDGNRKVNDRTIKNFMRISFVVLTILVGLRGNTIGSDTIGYLQSFQVIGRLEFADIFSYNFDSLFTVLCFGLSKMFGNPQSILIVCAIITHICVLYYIKRNSRSPFVSVFLFITLYFLFMEMNGMRQFVSIGLLLVATEKAKEKKFFQYLLFIFLSIGFHSTGVLGIIIWFLYQKPNNVKKKKKILLIAMAFYALFIFFNLVLPIARKLFRNGSYYLRNFGSDDHIGVMLIVLTLAVFVFNIIASLDIEWANDSNNMFHLFMSEIAALWSVGIAIFGISIDYNLIQRIIWFFQIYSIVSIPNCLESKIMRNNRVFLILLIIIAGIAYMTYYLLLNWHRVVPYYFV